MASRGRDGGRRGGAWVGQPSQIEQPTLEAGPSDPAFAQDEVAISNTGLCMSGKKGQRKTRNTTLVKRKREGEKLAVDFPPNLMRAVGNNAQVLITELGIIVRQMATLHFSKWKSIPDDDKLKMWHAVKEAVYQQLNRQYRDYRHRLHKEHYCKYNTDEMRLENSPSSVGSDDWVDLVKYFGSEEFMKISNRNKENR